MRRSRSRSRRLRTTRRAWPTAYSTWGTSRSSVATTKRSSLAYVEEVIARYRDLGDERGAARAAWARGILAMGAGRFEEAAESLEHGLAEFERLDNPEYRAMTMGGLGWAAFAQGDVPTAARMAVEALLGSYRMRDIGTTTISLHVGVLMAGMLGRYEDAAVINGAFDALCERYGVRPPAALERFIGTSDPFVATREALDTASLCCRIRARARDDARRGRGVGGRDRGDRRNRVTDRRRRRAIQGASG